MKIFNTVQNKIKLALLLIAFSISFGLSTNAIVKNSTPPTASAKKPVITKISEASYEPVSSLDVVAHPSKYLNKHIKIRAKFDKFSALGLDYKPAFRSSEKYITFLIKRDDVKDHTIPLSEMKNFLKREEAEKYIDLKAGDEIEYYGVVFSDALSDAWVDVEKFVVINPKPKEQAPAKK